MTTKGKLMAAAVAGLFLSVAPTMAHAEDSAKVKCEGVNKCKGQGGCKSAKNDCKGKNGCGGKGWTETTAKECKDKGGKVLADAKDTGGKK